MKKRITAVFLVVIIAFSLTACGESEPTPAATEEVSDAPEESATEEPSESDTDETADSDDTCKYADQSPEDVLKTLTLEQKAAQMVQPAIYEMADPNAMMEEADYGSVLSKSQPLAFYDWAYLVDELQKAALSSEAGVPFIYGQDDVHGVNYCLNSVLFPHNIGMGATGDADLMKEVGLITADEAKLCHMLWNFAPCVAQSVDPRWGRTYESYGADLELIKKLGTAYTEGLVEGGVVACPKHYFGDGNVKYGTGEKSDVDRLIDRGDAQLSEKEIEDLLSVYQAQIDAGAQTIMISHSALNGVKMHENAEYIMKLKNEMGFKGFIESDWNSIENTSPTTYEDQVVTCVNAGLDMLMEVSRYDEARQIIVDAVNDGRIEQSRVDDAVLRILTVKKNIGLFEDPMLKNMKTVQTETGSQEYREVAERAVEESLVLLKNENKALPLKKGTKVYIIGPAANSERAQCGGWTLDWNQSPDENIEGVTSIEEAFDEFAADYGVEVVYDSKDADVVLLAVGEQAYAEWNGDTEDMELCGALGLDGNQDAIDEAKALQKKGKKVVACIIAGRQVIIEPYEKQWDGIVMCYLPGSEGKGIVDVLCGQSKFTGKLPSPWYSSVDQIGTDKCRWKIGYGLTA